MLNKIVMLNKISKILDIVLIPFVFPLALVLKLARRVGLKRLKITRKVLVKIGIIPVINHYYDPFISEKNYQNR